MEGEGVRNANEVPSKESHQLAYQRLAKDERKHGDCQDKGPSVGAYMTTAEHLRQNWGSSGSPCGHVAIYFAHESP